MKYAEDFVNSMYDQIINNAIFFDEEEVKKINTIKEYERLLSMKPSTMDLSIAGSQYFWWVERNACLPMKNRIDLLDKVSLSLSRSKLDNVDKTNINKEIDKLRSKEIPFSELKSELLVLMKKYSGKVTRDNLVVKGNHAFNYLVARSFYYLIIAMPVLLITGYIFYK